MSLELGLRGYRLTMLEIIYQMPDHPSLVQEFIWQTYDIAPLYPRVHRFLKYWDLHIEGRRLITRLDTKELISPTDYIQTGEPFRLN